MAKGYAAERGEPEEEDEEDSINDNASRMKKVQVVTSKGHVLATYESQKEAARRTGIDSSYISAVCLGR